MRVCRSDVPGPIVLTVFLLLSCIKPGTGQGPPRHYDGLIINEVMPAEAIGKPAWVELYNSGSDAVPLDGLCLMLTNSVSGEDRACTLAGGEVPPGERHVICSELVPFAVPLIKATFEEVSVTDPEGIIIDSFAPRFDFPSGRVPGRGESYARIPDAVGNWDITSTPTPGEMNYKIIPYLLDGLIINEVCPSGKWVELVGSEDRELQLEHSYLKNPSGGIIYTSPIGETIPQGGRLVIHCDADASELESFACYDNSGKRVASFSSSGLEAPPPGGSWSRLPDSSGEWHITGSPTPGEVNERLSDDDSGLRINELSPSAGWIEIVNPTVDIVRTRGLRLSIDGTVVYESGSIDLRPGDRISIDVGLPGDAFVSLHSVSGNLIDTFSSDDVEDGAHAGEGSSWSRIPDGSGKWYTVPTPTRDAANYGITEGNTVAIWVPQSLTNSLDLERLCTLGFGHVLLHEYAFRNFGRAKVEALVRQAEGLGMKLHIWLQCFWWNDEVKWRLPVIDPQGGNPPAYNQPLFDEILARAASYLESGVHGIHFDYIRFGGTGGRHNYPEHGITATGAITEFCRQANAMLKALDPGLMLSAAVMGEMNAQLPYGQDPQQMGRYLDILMPMAYISSYSYSPTVNLTVANWFADRCPPAQCWHGISTYDRSTAGLSAAEIHSDCLNITGSRAGGVALFRYGIGTLPDLTGMFLK